MKYESFRNKIKKENFNDISTIVRNGLSFIIMTIATVAVMKFVPFKEMNLDIFNSQDGDEFFSFYAKGFVITFVAFYFLMYFSFFIELINSILIYVENKSQNINYPITFDNTDEETDYYNNMSKREKVIDFLSMISAACSNAIFSIVGIFFLVIGIGITIQNNEGMIGGIIVAIMGLAAAIAGLSPTYNNIMAYVSQRTGKTFNPIGIRIIKRFFRVLPSIFGTLVFIGLGAFLIVLSFISGLAFELFAIIFLFGLVFLIAGIILAKHTIPNAIDEIKYGSDD